MVHKTLSSTMRFHLESKTKMEITASANNYMPFMEPKNVTLQSGVVCKHLYADRSLNFHLERLNTAVIDRNTNYRCLTVYWAKNRFEIDMCVQRWMQTTQKNFLLTQTEYNLFHTRESEKC